MLHTTQQIHSLPATCLVQAFSHKVSREIGFKQLLVLKGVMQLSVGHAAALKPAIKDIIHTPQHTITTAAGDCKMVDEVSMQIGDLCRRLKESSKQ